MIEVVFPGARTTIQDLGRFGHRSIGVAPAGAFDEIAARIANARIGNPPEAALLEATLTGPTLRFETTATVAVAGAACGVTLDGEAIDASGPITVPSGARLTIGTATRGVRAYLAVTGGIDVPAILGSRSTHVASGLGPLPLRPGDRLPVGTPPASRPRRLDEPSRSEVVRVVGLAAAFEATVRPDSDRTGVRLDAARIDGGESDPAPMLPGMIQVPPDGRPIVLGPDAPTTGGYRTIGCVARIDLGVLAQARPGAALRFEPCAATDARAAWEDAIRWIAGST